MKPHACHAMERYQKCVGSYAEILVAEKIMERSVKEYDTLNVINNTKVIDSLCAFGERYS